MGRAGTRALVALALALPVAIVASALLPRPVAAPLAFVAYGWLGLALLLFFLLLPSVLVRAGVLAAASVGGRPLDPDRRLLLARGIAGMVGLAALVLGGSGAASALGSVAIQRVRVALRRMPRALSGFRIAHLTDLHIGPTIDGG